MSNSNYSGRISRSLEEAFGPHCRQILQQDKPETSWAAIALGMAYVLAVIVIWVVL